MHFSRCEIISEVHISLKKFSMNIERLFSGQTELKKCIWKCDMLCWLCQLGRRTGGARRGEVWSCENPLIPVAAAAELQSSPASRSGLRGDEALNICEVCHVPPPVLLPSHHLMSTICIIILYDDLNTCDVCHVTSGGVTFYWVRERFPHAPLHTTCWFPKSQIRSPDLATHRQAGDFDNQ